MVTWTPETPIYRQLRDRTVAMILDGALRPGDPLPSVRQVAADLQVNPLTVSKAYQMLTEEGVAEKRRGLGLFVTDIAPVALLAAERAQFIEHEWPLLRARLDRLHLDPATLWSKETP